MNARQLIVKAEYFVQAVAEYLRASVCPYCRGREHVAIARKAVVVRVVRCAACGLAFTRPTYRTWLSRNFYDSMYSAEGSTTSLPGARELERLRAVQFRGTDKDASKRLASMSRVVNQSGAHLLEIGSSWGYFLFQASLCGFHPVGLETASTRRRYGCEQLGQDIRSGWSAIPAEERFDVVYTSHTLEHFTDISGVFDDVASRLASGGHLFVEVPNFDVEQFGSRVLSNIGAIHPLGFDSNWFWRNLPRHKFEVIGTYGSWINVGETGGNRSAGDSLIVYARKAGKGRRSASMDRASG